MQNFNEEEFEKVQTPKLEDMDLEAQTSEQTEPETKPQTPETLDTAAQSNDDFQKNQSQIDLVTVSPVEFSEFEDEQCFLSDDLRKNLDIMQDVKMRIHVELGRARCSVKKILDFQKGSIVELNKVAGEQVELYANGKFVAYGEVIVIEDKFGLRVTSIASPNLPV